MDMELKEQERENYVKKIDLIRGEFLGKWILLEDNINLFLNCYFCAKDDTKYIEFEMFLMGIKDFKSKLSIFKTLTFSHTKNKDAANKIISGIEKHNNTRNLFAHRISSIPKSLNSNLMIFYINGKPGTNNNNNNPTVIGQYNIDDHEKTLIELEKLALTINKTTSEFI